MKPTTERPTLTARNNVSTTVTPDAVAKVDYSAAVSPLALPDARKPNLHPLEYPIVEFVATRIRPSPRCRIK
ncbi:hypothetical protein Hanom_Chr03g00273801 [Helianthus anomalus]